LKILLKKTFGDNFYYDFPIKINYYEYDFIFIKNDIKNSFSSFGIKISNSTNINILLDHNIIEKNLIGLNFLNNNSLKINMKNCKILLNKDSGVVIFLNKIKSKFNFMECLINTNQNFGVNANNNSNNINFNVNTNNSEIIIFRGEINNNDVGLSYESFLCRIDSCKFIDNKSFSIQINEEKYKDNLKMLNYEKNIDNLINTKIGGNWGILNEDKCISCKNGKCLIF